VHFLLLAVVVTQIFATGFTTKSRSVAKEDLPTLLRPAKTTWPQNGGNHGKPFIPMFHIPTLLKVLSTSDQVLKTY
jgi:hypothetical protein